jgi:AcrR family transcriptional regulator
MAHISTAERSAELVAAAVRTIAAHGVEGATTRRISQEANCSLATLHYCFGVKEVLLAAVFEHVTGQYREVLTRNNVRGDVGTTARALLRDLMEWYMANPDFGPAIIELFSWARRQEGKQAQMVYNDAFGTMREVLEAAGPAAGQSIDQTTINELTYIVSTLSDGFALSWLVFADRTAAERQIELTLSVLDAWMAANLGAASARRSRTRKTASREVMHPLLS